MKLTLNWLREYLDTNAAIDTITAKMVDLGHEIASVTDRAALYKGFIIAHVAECDKHPNADKLKLCLVNTGKEQLQVVCGAPNVRKGLRVVFALPGAVVPANGLVLKKTKIRDVDSNGMICSEAELKLSDEANGIMELPADAPLGADFATYMGLNDPVIEAEITPNRPDCLGVYGLARDLAAAGLGRLKTLPQQPVPGGFDCPITVTLDFKPGTESACPLFMGRVIRGVKNGPSPKWLRDYLTAVGLRPISALVDITNFVCLGFGRPLHVFDADQLNGNITVRLSRAGESFTDLTDTKRTMNSDVTVVCDNTGIQAMGGVIGGLHSGCTDKTENVFLESAYFSPARTRATAKEYGIDSDAKYRFERGVDPAFCDEGIAIATRLIFDMCGGEPSYLVVAGNEPNWYRTIPYNPTRAATLGGLNVPASDQTALLMRLGFTTRERPDGLIDVNPPSWRGDIEGEADIVEEVLRVKGYDTIPPVSVRSERAVPAPALDGTQKRLADMRRLCAANGLTEAVTWSFLSGRAHAAFSYTDKKTVRIANPISQDLGIMRHSMLPNLLDAVKRNADRKLGHVHVFETGPVFFDTLPDTQPVMLTGMRAGDMAQRTWEHKAQAADFFAVKRDVWALLKSAGLNPDGMPITRDAPSWFHPGRSATLRLGKTIIAQFGVLHPSIQKIWDIDFPVAAFEIFVDALPGVKDKKTTTKPTLTLNPLQPVTRDFAFIIANDLPADQVIKAAKNADKNLIADVTLFDVYAGKGVDPDKRSIAFTVTLQPVGDSLTDAALDGVSKNIIGAVEKLGGVLRG
jgi:phenylalanyl-tRNA synthetase beta chain